MAEASPNSPQAEPQKQTSRPPSHRRPRRKEARNHRVSIMLNDSEMRALQRYLDRYDVSNRSRLIREALMRTILEKFDHDSPTLFD